MPRAARTGGRSLSCCSEVSAFWYTNQRRMRTVKPMRSGPGLKVPLAVVDLGPTSKRSATAFTQGKPVAAAYGLPAPDP